MSFTDSFLRGYSSVNYMVRHCMMDQEYCEIVLRELKDVIKQKSERNAQLREMLKEHIGRIENLNEQLQKKEGQLKELYRHSIGMPMTDGMMMKYEYEHGMSLRKLAETYNCDKSTVKRRLIKMGVAIRK